jgi:RNA polymerase sigma-70 factor (ECF subfamily)
MCASGARTDILLTGPETVVTDALPVQHAPFAQSAAAREREHRETGTRESFVAGMSRQNIKQAQRVVAPSHIEGSEQLSELIVLYETYKRPLHTYIYRLLGSQEDADDLTQEVFMRAFTSWEKLYDRGNLSPWLYRIATNLCVDQLRRRKRISWWPLTRRRGNEHQSDWATEEDAPYLPSDCGGIPEVLEREQIRLVLASMPEDYAVVLVLSAAQGLPYQDIATIVGISPNAAATRISRAKRMFAEEYKRLNEEAVYQREAWK